MDAEELREELGRFGGTDAERRAVARQARDMADAGVFERDEGRTLTVETVLDELDDAPDGSPADRWNWWLGALEVSHGDYERFQVRRWAER
mgnify:CR=1 FL=1